MEGTLTLNYTKRKKNLSTKEIIIAPPEKVYDGTTAVQAKDVLSLANLDIVERDKGFVGITADVAFDTKDVVEGKNVTISNIKLTGEKAGNYWSGSHRSGSYKCGRGPWPGSLRL